MTKIVIELKTGPQHNVYVTQKDIQRNIDAVQRASDGKGLAGDFIILTDTISILEGIKSQLPPA